MILPEGLVDHLGSNDGQTFLVSHAWLCREPLAKKTNLLMIEDYEKQVSLQIAFDAFGPG